MLDAERIRTDIAIIRQQTDRPFNVNFFCHAPAEPDTLREERWRSRLAGYYEEFGLDPEAEVPAVTRAPSRSFPACAPPG